MNDISQTGYSNNVSNVNASYQEQTSKSQEKKKVSGATYGDAKLTDKAQQYYNKLKEKYGNMNFVLVASDKKEEAEAIKGSFASKSKLTVLIDTDKIEKMATDEKYRKQYESILDNATSGLSQMQTQLGSATTKTVAYGMTVKDNGVTSYFAVIDKSLDAQKERITKKAEEKAIAKKSDAKKAQKKKSEEQLEAKRTESDSDDSVTITANSVEELKKKIDDYYMSQKSDNVLTESEKKVGQTFDYSV